MKWNLVPLGTVCTVSSSKRIFAKEYCTDGIPFYRGKEVIEKHKGNPVSTELFISKERYEEIRSNYDVPQIGDVLLTSVGTLGVSWLVDETDFYFKDGNLTWLRAKNGLLNKFLYLWLNSDDAKRQIDMMCIGSTQKALTIETINKFLIPLPSMQEQEDICSAIYPIMERIKNNRNINDNLQQQALAISQRELLRDGELPEGWSNGSLLDIANYLNGLAMQKFRPAEGETGLPVLKIKELRQGFCDASSERCSPSIKPEYIVHDGDVIFSWSGSLLVDL